jgi:DUF4097 and DUF4098 domain-containing protein YvlB
MQKFDTPNPAMLHVRNSAGRIEIYSIDGDSTEVDVRPLSDDAASRDAAAATEVDLRSEGAKSVVSIVVPRSGRLFKHAEVHVVAHVPHGTDLDVTSGSADVDANGRYGMARFKTASGDIDFDTAGSEVKVASASGDVRVGSAGGEAVIQTASGDVEVGNLSAPAKVQTASGDVHIGEARSSLKVQSASGDQAVDTVSAGDIRMQSASGDLRIGVKPGSTLWIDAKSISGSTTSELEDTDAPVEPAGPHLEIHAATMSGDVAVVRSQAVSA